MTGAWVGAALGFLSFAALRHVAARIEAGTISTPEPKTAAKVIRIAGIADLLLFPVMGYVLGPMVLAA